MSTIDDAIRNHMAAAAELVQHALAAAAAEDRAGADGLARAIRAGGMLTLMTTLTTTGAARLSVNVTTPAGESLGELIACELLREVQQ
jgi:hypothetical protein